MGSTLPRPSFREHLKLAAKVNDLAWTLDHLHDTYGPVADVGYRIPIRLVYLMGVEANRYLLSEHPENFTWNEAFSLLEVVNGPTALVLSDGDEHRRRRRLVQPAFAIKRVDAHLGLVVTEIDRALASWTPGVDSTPTRSSGPRSGGWGCAPCSANTSARWPTRSARPSSPRCST